MFIMLVIRNHFCFNTEMLQQNAGVSSVFCKNQVCLLQHIDCAQRDVFKITNGGRYDKEHFDFRLPEFVKVAWAPDGGLERGRLDRGAGDDAIAWVVQSAWRRSGLHFEVVREDDELIDVRDVERSVFPIGAVEMLFELEILLKGLACFPAPAPSRISAFRVVLKTGLSICR